MNLSFSKIYIGLIVALMALPSCIKNDIPYPVVFGGFTSFVIKGQIGETLIDNETQTLSIIVPEEKQLTQLEVIDYSLTEDTEVSPNPKEISDFSASVFFTLSTYQDYRWEVIVNQSFEYSFIINNQVCDSDIDTEDNIITAFVSSDQSLDNVDIILIKLGPDDGTVISPDPSTVKDFNKPVTFSVTQNGETEEWLIQIGQKDYVEGLDGADISKLVFDGMLSDTYTITGNIGDGNYGYIDINFSEQTDLSAVSLEEFEYSEGSYYFGDWQKGDVIDLSQPVKITLTSGSCISKRWLVRAHNAIQMPNTNFSDWHKRGNSGLQQRRNVHHPWLDANLDYNFWGTPNVYVWPVTTETTTPIEGTYRGDKYARMETIATGSPLSSFPQIAAGTIFTGRFYLAGTSVTDSPNSVSFGEKLQSRPLALKFKAAYTPSKLTYKDNSTKDVPDDLDKAHVWVKLMYLDGDIDYENGIDHTTPQGSKPQALHLPNGAIVVGEAEKIIENNVSWDEFTLPIEYDILTANYSPTHIAIVATASMEGESFTGGVGSILEIDYFELEY